MDKGDDPDEVRFYLDLLRTEGFRLLAAFRKIDDPQKRAAVISLAEHYASRAARFAADEASPWPLSQWVS